MQKVLLLDTNFSSAPIYHYLVKSGFEVFVVGGNPNDFLAKSVKTYINQNYSIVEQTRALIEEKRFDYIVPGCNDLSYQICAEINSQGKFYGLDTPETTETINNKYKFRAFAAKIGLPVPELFPEEKVNKIWPLIVKPVDAYSGHGMTVLRKFQQKELPAAIDSAKKFSRSRTCIIEEFVEGQFYSHSAFIRQGEIFADFIVEEYNTANPFVVDTSRVIFSFPKKMLDSIRDSITFMAEKLNLVDGLVHTQFIQKGNSFWLIEITRRCPGDLYSQLIELSTGFKYAQTYARPFVRQQYPKKNNTLKKTWIMRHTMSLPTEGTLGSIKFNVPVTIEKMLPISLAGDRVKASPYGRIALIFLRSKSEKELLKLYKKTLDRNLYAIQNTY